MIPETNSPASFFFLFFLHRLALTYGTFNANIRRRTCFNHQLRFPFDILMSTFREYLFGIWYSFVAYYQNEFFSSNPSRVALRLGSQGFMPPVFS